MPHDFFKARDILHTSQQDYVVYRLDALEKAGLTRLDRLPFSIRILLEASLRQCNDREITRDEVIAIAGWKPVDPQRPAIAFLPARVIMQDFTGVPALVDLAAMRSAVSRLGGDPRLINPVMPVDLVIDHSIQVDFFASADALQRNSEMEFLRNRERYEFLKWGQSAFENFRLIPPATGIVHQVNLEYLAQVVLAKKEGDDTLAYPDSLVGTDSHTSMINGLGVVGWGVGGIEADAVMLGQPLDMLLPDVTGFRLQGKLQEGVTATDLVLTITQILRRKGVVGRFIEFFGPGLDNLALPDRASIGNMAPEYGATMGFFTVDAETIRYLRLTGRSEEVIERTEAYLRLQGLFRDENTPDPEFTDTIELDLKSVEPSLAGPKCPQDRVPLSGVKAAFQRALTAPLKEGGFELKPTNLASKGVVGTNGGSYDIGHGTVVLAAITSCTNTSNPTVMVAAGLLAKKAVARGLTVKPYVKTSLAPGSRVVSEYLRKAELLEPLADLGFNLVAYGCTTCIGNSGPLPGEVNKAIAGNDLVVAALLSGNRNFEGRVHPMIQANYLASPPLVVAYALAGTLDIDLVNEPLGTGSDGEPVYLRQIWPSTQEIMDTIAASVSPDMFTSRYADIFSGSDQWKDIQVTSSDMYAWQESSTYIQQPPFFQQFSLDVPSVNDIKGAHLLALLGDSITTDHISPAGSIHADSPAGRYLQQCGVAPRDFNSYGSRRGNDQVMIRGTFANIRLKNLLVPGMEGGVTRYFGPQPNGFMPSERTQQTGNGFAPSANGYISIYDAAMLYQQAGIPLIIIAGKDYGSGSSRDWAAKGTVLLGVRAVIAESFERVHCANLVGMGVLPLQFEDGQNAASLGLDGTETFDIEGVCDGLMPESMLNVRARKADGSQMTIKTRVLFNSQVEVNYYHNGGILPAVLRRMLTQG
jgi:aconitate hydratase